MMETLLLASRRTYSISKKKPVIEWKTIPFNVLDIKQPNDFDVRLVNADLYNKPLDDEFKELHLRWQIRDKIRSTARKMFNNGCFTDIALYIDNLKIGLIVESHCKMNSIIKAQTLDDLKKELLSNEI